MEQDSANIELDYQKTRSLLDHMVEEANQWMKVRSVTFAIDDFARHEQEGVDCKYWCLFVFRQSYPKELYPYPIDCELRLFYSEPNDGATGTKNLSLSVSVNNCRQETLAVSLQEIQAEGLSNFLQSKFELARSWIPPFDPRW